MRFYVGATIRDASERARILADVVRSEAAFRELVEQAADAVFIADLDGRYTEVNSAACRLLGLTRDELVGRRITDFIPAEDIGRLEAAREYLRVPGRVQVERWRLRTKSGALVPVDVSAKIHPDGRWVAFARDVSAQVRAEEALRHSEESLAHAQHVAKIGSWDWDLATNRVERSRELLRLFGAEPATTPAERGGLNELIHPEDRERVVAALDAATTEGGSYAIEHRIVRADGEERIVWQEGAAIVEGGRTVRMVGTLRDVTEQRRAEQELARLRAEWSSVVAHDLRQPLNTMLLYADVLKRSRDPSDAAASVERIVSAGRRLNRMIGDLMDLSRLEARRLELARRRVDLRAIVRATVEQIAIGAPERSIQVRVRGELREVDADPDRAAQVVENLLSNAVKYGAAGSAIEVELEGGDAIVTVAVSSSGKGIAPDQVARLFQRFQRTDDARGSKIEGTGLGLYIVRELVEAHGGTVSVESTPGATTTFRFTLPVAR